MHNTTIERLERDCLEDIRLWKLPYGGWAYASVEFTRTAKVYFDGTAEELEPENIRLTMPGLKDEPIASSKIDWLYRAKVMGEIVAHIEENPFEGVLAEREWQKAEAV